MADIYGKAKRSEIMSCVKHTRTAPEEKVAGLLRLDSHKFTSACFSVNPFVGV